MRPLILILLAVISAEAQTLADAARQERARQARVQSVRVFTTDGIRTTAPPAPAGPARPVAPAASPAVAAAPAVDPVLKWNEDMEKQRARLRELQLEETAIQLQLNDLTNQFTAPVTDEITRRQVQARLQETQVRFDAVRSQLDQARSAVQAMEAQGPPAPRR